MSRFAIIFFLLTGCVSSSYNLSSERPIKPSGARYRFASIRCLEELVENKAHRRAGSIFELTTAELHEAAVDDGLGNYLGEPGESDSVVPLRITVTPSGVKNDTDGWSGFSTPFFLVTLGVIPWFSSCCEMYEVVVRCQYGKDKGSFVIDSNTWTGWIPIICPYPASADLRGNTWEYNPEDLFARGVARTAISIANNLAAQGGVLDEDEEDEDVFGESLVTKKEDVILTIDGRGVGTTKSDALTRARRDALEKAVGLYVDTRQLVRNAQLIRNKILSQDYAYIERCDITNAPRMFNGTVTVQVTVLIDRRKLQKGIGECFPGYNTETVGESQETREQRARASGQSVNEKQSWSGGNSSGVETVLVKGTGTGIDETSALKDAYRDAVEHAVGVYVDSEQIMRNDEVIKDQILAQSNAYIESYDITKRTVSMGLVTVDIKAKVRRGALAKRLGEGRRTTSRKVGNRMSNVHDQLSTIHAQSVTETQRSKDGAELLGKKLEEIDVSNLYVIGLASAEGTVVSSKEGSVVMSYPLKLSIDQERYFNEFVPYVDAVLSQVSAEEPKIVKCEKKYATGRWAEDEIQRGEWIYSKRRAFELVFDCDVGANGRYSPVFLIVKADADTKEVEAKRYMLDLDCRREYDRWARRELNNPRVEVRFTDKAGKAILGREIEFDLKGNNGSRRRAGWLSFKMQREMQHLHWQWSNHQSTCRGCSGFHIAPWFEGPWIGSFAQKVLARFEFELATDDLPKVKSIDVETLK